MSVDWEVGNRITAVGYRWRPIPMHPICPLCLGREGHQHTEGVDRYGYRVGLTLCQAADAWFLDPYLTDAQVADFYGKGWYRKLVSAYHGRDVLATLAEEQRKYGKWLDSVLMAARMDDLCCILDVGGSTGVVGNEMQNKEILVGLDPAIGEGRKVRSRRSRYDIGIRATLESAPEFEPTFDLILCCQTLDHLREPRHGLTRMGGWLAPDGLLWVDILDVNEQVTRFGGDWRQVRKCDHPNGFCRASLVYLLEQTGFEAVKWVEVDDHIVPDHVGVLAKKAG